MVNESKTLYLWDLADTLFGEDWDVKKSGFPNYDAYVESLGYDLKTMDAKTYEWDYERPFKAGLMKLSLLPGFIETLSWTGNNAVFTTGNVEQIDWRAEVFLKNGLPDIRPFFSKIYSTFDYGNTNSKASGMFFDILKKESAYGYSAIVYADNKRENCRQFLDAANQIKNISYRLYHIKEGAARAAKISDNFFETTGLPELLKNEKSLL